MNIYIQQTPGISGMTGSFYMYNVQIVHSPLKPNNGQWLPETITDIWQILYLVYTVQYYVRVYYFLQGWAFKVKSDEALPSSYLCKQFCVMLKNFKLQIFTIP